MIKSGANESWRWTGVVTALTIAVVLLGSSGKGSASGRTTWPRATYYTVVAHPGDTVSKLGGRYRVSPSTIAKLNGLTPIDHIRPGRVLLIPAQSDGTRAAVLSEALDLNAPNFATAPKSVSATYTPVSLRRAVAATAAMPRVQSEHANERQRSTRFSWPIAGPVISSFGPGERGTRNDGINIAAEFGAPVRAAADGTVSYAGSLRGYGNLILITHANGFVTAYAHAENIAVVPGQEVGKGQVIGTAGNSGGVDRPQLHFEIRRGAKAINPGLLLAANG